MEGIELRARKVDSLDDAILLEVSGYIDTVTSRKIEEQLLANFAEGHRLLLLDLSNVDYISSAGWGIFISVIRQLRDDEGDLQLIGMQPDVFEVYELLEFQSILEAWPCLDDALGALAK